MEVLNILIKSKKKLIYYNFCNSSSRYINSSQAFADPEHTNHALQRCSGLYVGDDFWVLVTEFRCWGHLLDVGARR